MTLPRPLEVLPNLQLRAFPDVLASGKVYLEWNLRPTILEIEKDRRFQVTPLRSQNSV